MKESPNVVDLFCGAGGLTLGFERAGFNTLVASDYQKDTLNTYKTNFPEAAIVQKDIRELTAEELMEAGSFDAEDVDMIIGGPPCKGFSMAGERDPDDPRNSLFEEYIRIVKKLDPDAILMENVKGILTMQDGAYVEKILTQLRNLGYKVPKPRVVNAADFGVPQTRERVIFTGVKDGSFNLPDPTHKGIEKGQTKIGEKSGSKPYVTIEEAVSDLSFLGPGEESSNYEKEPESEYQREMRQNANQLMNHKAPNHSSHIVERFSKIEEGKGMESLPEEEQTAKHSLQKWHREDPANTVTTLPEDFVHYSKNRIPTVREMARIQSFPDDFEFKGPRTTGGKRRRHSCPQYSQIGNAVPPKLAEALAEGFLNSYFQKEKEKLTKKTA